MICRLRLTLAAALCGLAACAALAAEPDRGASWSNLTPGQKQALAPLQRDWPSLDAQRRQKWLEVASRFGSMQPDERDRVLERMTEWARMTPAQRTRARLQFQEARQLPADERQARWQAYQSLTPEQRSALAARAKPAARPASAPDASQPSQAAATTKRNLVPTSPPVAQRAVAPTVVQAKPGATTTAITAKAAPPLHHQAGLPKIAATPGFVDPATLLPQRGPQGAAARSVASREPARSP